MCQTLACRKSPADQSCTYTLGASAVDGTTCGSGQACSLGYCVASSSAPVSTCPFGDDIVQQYQVGFTLPNNAAYITCQNLLNYVISINQSPNYYCQANVLGSVCCQSCQSKKKLIYYLLRTINIV